jgi:hypothetical protein
VEEKAVARQEIMTIKAGYILEWSVGDRKYQFSIPDGSPYGEIYDATFAFWRKAHEIKMKADEEAMKLAEADKKESVVAEIVEKEETN